MVPHLSWNAAALSLLVPGWGQHDQGRTVAGRLFLGWAALSLLVAAYGPWIGIPGFLAWADVAAVTVCSVANALFQTRPVAA